MPCAHVVNVQQVTFSVIKIGNLGGEGEVGIVSLAVSFYFLKSMGDREEWVIVNLLSLSIF